MRAADLNRRRVFTRGGVAFGLAFAAPVPGLAYGSGDALHHLIMETELRLRARLGVVIRDTGSGRAWQHRADERFPMCSTFKALAVGAVLAKVDAGQEDLSRRIVFGADQLVTYSPITQHRTGGAGMTLGELCAATLATSDNTAGNLVLRAAGGPEGLTGYLRSIGDGVTRLDRWETALNEARPGDPRDTTSPAAITATLERLVVGNTLSPASRAQLLGWLLGNQVSGTKLKAGLPAGWRVADRTGAGAFGTNNVVGAIYPPGRKPVLVGIFATDTEAPATATNAAMADLARALSVIL